MFTRSVSQTILTTDQTFTELGLSAELVDAVTAIGFNHPTRIQAQAIPLALAGGDVLGLAETGSGKTAAFGLPMVEQLRHGNSVRGLILSPTREIALQTRDFLETVGQHHGLRTAILIGGVRMGPQIDDLRRGPDIVVATPGRLLDHVRRGNVSLDRIEKLVLDEADHMLDLGFLPQISEVLELIPKNRQTMMFSATMPQPIERLVHRLMDSPARIDIIPHGRTARGIEHRLFLVEPDNMRPCLMALAAAESGSILVFLKRKIDAEWAYSQLLHEGHSVERIHSDRSQSQRVKALGSLRTGTHRILIATNIAARGIDIPIIEHIVNFGVPDTAEEYVHRAGRTARGDAKGVVSTIATWKEKEQIRMIEKAIDAPLPRLVAAGVEPYLERRKTIRGRPIRRRRLL
jgi:ATP-dependent RNA helicase RhlE